MYFVLLNFRDNYNGTTIESDTLKIRFLGKGFILNRRNICSFFMNSQFLVHRYLNQLRIAFRTRVLLVCHLVYLSKYFLRIWDEFNYILVNYKNRMITEFTFEKIVFLIYTSRVFDLLAS
jgi:hypothetical protein